MRWSGELEPPVTGEYTFTLHANDGGKLTVGELALGRWEALSGFREVGKVSLKAGERVPFAFEFFDNYGEASARVFWKGRLSGNAHFAHGCTPRRIRRRRG